MMQTSLVPVRGLRFAVRVAGWGPPLVLLHGFTGSGLAWRPFAPRLGQLRRVVAVDLIGHGATSAPREAARYAMEEAVLDLAALLDRLGLGTVDLLGYSLGGRVALRFALAFPGRIRSLMLESASAGIEEAAARAERLRRDEELARRIERFGVAAFVDKWERLPLFASQRGLAGAVWAQQRSQRLRNRPEGLAGVLRGMSPGRIPPVHRQLSQLNMPVGLIAGALDEKYCAEARKMAGGLADAEIAIVPDAGHNVHLERPEAFERWLVERLERDPAAA